MGDDNAVDEFVAPSVAEFGLVRGQKLGGRPGPVRCASRRNHSILLAAA